ncbi:MAG: hypothetical protein AABX66_01480 [Nanoarchaeota archaeon]
MQERKLEPHQMAAIVRGVLDGRLIQTTLPEIAEAYRIGKTVDKIVEEYDIIHRFNIPTFTSARNAIKFALRGYDGEMSAEQLRDVMYPGLLDAIELERLGKEHVSSGASKWSKENYRNGSGLFGITEEQRIINATKAGKTVKRLGKGIHAMDSAGKRAAAQKGNEMRGYICFSREEEQAIYDLSQQPEMSYGHKGYVNSWKVARKINNMFHHGHEVRNNLSISRKLKALKKNFS